ncbi:hypothetical protein LUZ60_007728 [Juncus effusus]|nr:hypothetical protein LUZ60_007728 [Juncus effusus]
MALFGRNPGRRPSNNYSTATVIVFVALVLVGVWMLTSSTFTPVSVTPEDKSQTNELAQETQNDVPTNTQQDDTGTNNENNSNESENGKENGESVSNGEQNLNEKTEEETIERLNEDTKGGNENKPNEKGENENTPNEDSTGENENKPNEDTNGEGENNTDTKGDNENNTDTKGKNENNTDTKGENENNEENRSENENNGSEETKGDNQNNGGEETKGENEKEQTKGENENNTTKFDDENGRTEELVKQESSNNETTTENLEETPTNNNNEETNNSNSNEEKPQEKIEQESEPNGAQSELLKETTTSNSTFSTQATESSNEKKVQVKTEGEIKEQGEEEKGDGWKLCASSAGADYIPCLDNEEAIKKLRTTKHYEHRERHCPDESPTCLVPLPEGYKRPIDWPHSRDKIWYHNVPHTKLADVKGHQNWVKVTGEYLTFPGGGTQFTKGALHYIDTIQESFPDIAWGKKTRVVLDVGCGVASFGGFLFERDVLTMSFAPKDEHEAQVQFALERGIPAISAVMGTKRLPYPGLVFDVVHCARCRVPWHIEGGMLLLELNRMLRPGGYFVWSATPVYQNLPEDVEIWNAMSELMNSMCWKMVKKTKDALNKVGLAIYQKPLDNNCYNKRPDNSTPPMCQQSDDPNAAWNVSLQACMHKIPESPVIRGAQWPTAWPERLGKSPYWLNKSQTGVYGKPAPRDFEEDYQHWKHVVGSSYVNGMGIDWSHVRNVMDMRAVYGGFAAALRDMKVWVMNIVPIDSPDTLPIIYERGLFGMYHDWCESFSTYPRSYDLLHADHLFSRIKKRCKILPLMAEVDRMLRPEGKLIVRDNIETINEIESIAKSLKYEVRMAYSKENEGLLCVQKTMWRPTEIDAPLS